jgi:hypothetical protein
MENKDLDKLFHDTFNDAEQTPNDQVWQNIEAALDKQKQNIVPLQRKKGFSWWSYAAAASVLVTLGIVFWTVEIAEDSTKQQRQIAMQPSANETTVWQGEQHEEVPTAVIKGPEQEYSIAEQTQTNIVATTTQPKEMPAPSIHPAEKKTIPTLDREGIESTVPNTDRPLATVHMVSTPPTYKVTEVEDIKPLIEPEEEVESMYASTSTKGQGKTTILTSLLNRISENVEISDTKEIRFSADEEGSLRVDVLNSLARNRNKKRR